MTLIKFCLALLLVVPLAASTERIKRPPPSETELARIAVDEAMKRVATRYGKPRPTIWPSSNSHQSEFGYVLDIGDPSQPSIKRPHPAAGGDQGRAEERRFENCIPHDPLV